MSYVCNMKKFSKNKNSHFTKNSSKITDKKVLKNLEKIIEEKAGSVSYFFVEERVSNIHSNSLKDMHDVKNKAVLHVNLTRESIENKTPSEIMYMFETTKWDLRANYFVIN